MLPRWTHLLLLLALLGTGCAPRRDAAGTDVAGEPVLAALAGEALHPARLAAYHLRRLDCAAAAEAAALWRTAAPDDPRAALTWSALAGDRVALCVAAPDLCASLPECAPEGCPLPLGYALLHEEEWGLAACSLREAVRKEPASADAHAWYGEALARLGYAAEAQRHLRQATTLEPESPLGWLLLGTHTLRQGESKAARAALLRAQRLDPANPAPCLVMAEVKAQMGRYDEVLTWIEAALKRAPLDPAIWKAVARFYLQRGLQQEDYPLAAARAAVSLAPDDPEAQMLLGWARLAEDDLSGAIFALDNALSADPDLAPAHYLRGLALQQTGEMEAAQEAFTRAAALGYDEGF